MNLPEIPKELILRLGPEVEAFERQNKNQNKNNIQRQIMVGEKKPFDEFIVNYIKDGIQNPKITKKTNLSFETKYLWIINTDGLFLILESTPNMEASRKTVCHSNITKGDKALQGGELWFLSPNHVIINFKSGRYGAETIVHEMAVIEYFNLLGFKVQIQDLIHDKKF
jgi:hypothetical protein